MKTPREILFSRHQSATPALDAIRQKALLQLPATSSESSSAPTVSLLGRFWQELVVPCRRIWTGLAVAWLFIFVVNATQRDNINSVTGHPVSPDQIVVNPMAEQRLMNELLADRTAVVPDVDRHRSASPKPRTAISPTAAV